MVINEGKEQKGANKKTIQKAYTIATLGENKQRQTRSYLKESYYYTYYTMSLS